MRFIREQINVEREIVDSLNKGIADIVNPAVRETLKGISFDSMKHAEMYSAALELLTKVPQAITQKQLERQRVREVCRGLYRQTVFSSTLQDHLT